MYKPMRPRPKKTDITRSRGGCQSCRARRTKCDEKKPSCGTCTRLGKVCKSIQPIFKFCMVTDPAPKSASSVSTSPGCSMGSRSEDSMLVPVNRQPISFGNIDIIKSLQHTERDVFYSTYWEDTCLPAMHPMFKSALHLSHGNSILSDAILALSSCNISRLHAESRGLTSSHMGAFSPNLVHQTRSQLYYSSAICKFNSLTDINYRLNSQMIFIVLILFAYIESSMGNFQGFNCHVHGLTNFLSELHETAREPMLKALLTAWMQVRFVVWWARAYFSELEVHRNLPSVPLPKDLEGTPTTIDERRVVILSIMCESHRLNYKALLQYWNPSEQGPIDCERFYPKLAQQAVKLEEWLSNLPEFEMPSDLSAESNMPIVFQSHDAALNFAYYVLARIMQCTESLRNLGQWNKQTWICSEENYWTSIMFRVALGIDMRISASRNSYTIGISGLLLAALLRCQDISQGLIIEKWLEDLYRLQPTEEGAFPTYQTLGVARTINRQRQMGCEVYGVSQIEDDAGGFPKFTAYNSQSINTLWLHGRYQVSGELFTERASIEL